MNKRIIRIILTLFLATAYLFSDAQAQIASSGEVNNTMRSHDKIYVVMAVCITILIGLILYIIRIDTKISRLEKDL